MEETSTELAINSQNPLQKVLSSKTSSNLTKKCPVCSSKFREQAEAMMEEGQSKEKILQFMKDNGENPTIYSISNHRNYHLYTSMIEPLGEYVDAVGEMVKRRRSSIDDVEHLLAVGWVELTKIVMLPTNGELRLEVQKQRMLNDLWDSILKTHEFMQKLSGVGKDKEIEYAFEQALIKRIAGAQTEDERNLVIKIMKDIQENLRNKQP